MTALDRGESNRAEPNTDERFELLFELSPQAIILHDFQGAINRVNDQTVANLGYARPQLLSMNLSEIEVELDPEDMNPVWEDKSYGDRVTVEGRHRRADGSTFPVEISVRKINYDGSKRFLALCQDISERKAYQNKLERQRNDLKLLNQMVCHDIRNNVECVSGYAEWLSESIGDEGQTQIEQIQDAADNICEITTTAQNVIDVLLQDETESVAIELASVVRDEITQVQSVSDTVAVTVEGSLPQVTVLADSMLHSVFHNLLTNAIDHNDKPTPEITISGEQDSETVRIRIADNGQTIPDAEKNRLFAEHTTGLDSEGSGLGLYLVHSLTNRYDGRVWIESNDPVGNVFVVELPKAGS